MNINKTGSGRLFVRKEYSDESVWRDTLQGEYLLVHSTLDVPPDAPEYIPAGSTRSDDVCISIGRTTHREDARFNYF
jgi:hypothetical protein